MNLNMRETHALIQKARRSAPELWVVGEFAMSCLLGMEYEPIRTSKQLGELFSWLCRL